jgi:endonuclease-3
LAIGKNVEEVEKKLIKRIPEEYFFHAHHWLILHGRYTCKARNPLCIECVISDLCPSKVS